MDKNIYSFPKIPYHFQVVKRIYGILVAPPWGSMLYCAFIYSESKLKAIITWLKTLSRDGRFFIPSSLYLEPKHISLELVAKGTHFYSYVSV